MSSHPLKNRRKRLPQKVALYTKGAIVVAIVLAGVLLFYFVPDFIANRYVKGRIIEGFTKAYPAYSIQIAGMHYNVWKDRIGCDSVAVTTADSTLSCTVARFSVSGIAWVHCLWGGSLALHDFGTSVVDAQDIVLESPQEQYELRCGLLRESVADSEIVIEALQLQPSGEDEQFFAGSKFRKARFRLVVPQARVMGVACLELLQGKDYRARFAQIHDVSLDVLLNKDKPYEKDTTSPPMPSEILSSIKGTLQVDSLTVINGQLKYGERSAVGSKPAWITLDSMHVLAEGIANHGGRGAALVIRAEGSFMKAGTMNVCMSIPVVSREFSYKYSGSMGRMDLTALNSFLEIAEQKRIKAGVLEAASFEINVVSGRASGSVRAVYKDLSLAAINKQTGSEKGFSDGIVSFIANTFTIRGTNVPDKSGSMKIGQVKYARKGDEYFMEYTWFALRSGVGDVVGF